MAYRDQDNPEIIDIGASGAGHQQVPQAGKDAISVVVCEMGLEVDTGGLSASQRIGQHKRARIILAAVNAVSVGCDCRYAFFAAERQRKASRNSAFRPPRPLPRTVTVVSPPEIMAQGGAIG